MAYLQLNPDKETYDLGNGLTAYRLGGMVTIIGSYTVTSSAANPSLWTLPSGWRPSATVIAPVYINKAYSSGWAPYVRVTAAGVVTIFSQGYAAAAYLSVTFATA